MKLPFSIDFLASVRWIEDDNDFHVAPKGSGGWCAFEAEYELNFNKTPTLQITKLNPFLVNDEIKEAASELVDAFSGRADHAVEHNHNRSNRSAFAEVCMGGTLVSEDMIKNSGFELGKALSLAAEEEVFNNPGLYFFKEANLEVLREIGESLTSEQREIIQSKGIQVKFQELDVGNYRLEEFTESNVARALLEKNISAEPNVSFEVGVS